MAASLVQSKISIIDNTVSVAFNSNNAAGNCIVVAVRYGADPGTVSDSKGNTYTLIQSDVQSSVYQKMWFAPNIGAGANTLTLSNKAALWIICEYSGVQAATPLDVSQKVQYATSGTISVTTTASGDLLVMAAGTTGTATPPSQTGAYSLRQSGGGNYGGTNHSLALYDVNAGAAGAYSNTAGGQALSAVFLAAFKAAPIAIQRGNIDYDQIRTTARQGGGSQFLMYGGSGALAWSMGVFDASGNLIGGGVWDETFVPTLTASGSMTVGSVTTNQSTWSRNGTWAIFSVVIGATIGGTVSNTVNVSLPIAMVGARAIWGFGQLNNPTASPVLALIGSSTPTVLSCQPYGGANYTLGSFSLGVTITYRCA